MVAKECTVHQNYKNKILKAKDIDTIATGKRLGHPVRCLKNQFTRELFKQEYNSNISDEELEKMGAGALRKAAKEGDEKTEASWQVSAQQWYIKNRPHRK